MSDIEAKKIKDNVKNTFDTVAKSYDNNRHFVISSQKLVQLIDVEAPQNILDISTGTGHIAIELAKKYPKAQIYGVDISEEMLRIARTKAEQQGVSNITFSHQDVESMEFDRDGFDIITCGYGLFFYPNMDGVLKDIYSRLNSGGEFVFSTFTDNAFQPYTDTFLEMLKDGYNIASPSRIEERQLKSAKEIEEFVTQINHNRLEVHDTPIRFPMDIEEWWSLLNTTGYSGLLHQLGEDYEVFEKHYLAHLKNLHEDNNIAFNADSLISVVIK